MLMGTFQDTNCTKTLKINRKITIIFSILIVCTISSVSYLAFKSLEAAVIDSELKEMRHEVQVRSALLESLNQRGSEDMLFAVKNPAFVQYFELPETRAGDRYDENGIMKFTENQRVLKAELEQWTYDFQSKFHVDEACLIDHTGQEHIRLVMTEIAPDNDLSAEEAASPFFEPSFGTEKGNAYIQSPYVSPDTERWVIAYTTPIVLTDASKPAFYHFEMPLDVFQALIEVEDGRMYVIDQNGLLIADSEIQYKNEVGSIPFGTNPENFFQKINSVSDSSELSGIVRSASAFSSLDAATGNYFEEGESRYIAFQKLPTFGWILVYDKPYSLLLAGDTSLSQLGMELVIASAIVGSAGLGIAFMVSSRISQPIREMAGVLKSQKSSALRKITIKSSTNEINEVTDALNEMILKINQNEARILESNKDLLKLDMMKSEFLSVASHELRTPIQPIMSYAELAIRGIIKPEVALTEIKKQSLRLGKLANDILDVAKIEGGRLVLVKEKLNLKRIISDVVNATRVSLHDNISIELKVHTKEDTMVFADKSRIEQVLSNIIGNAVKFTKEGTIIVETNLLNDSNYAEIMVTDHGPGIHKEVLPKLFEKFASRNGPNTGNEGGTGLGLYICKTLVEDHGGSISAFNNSDVSGATFRILLPTAAPLTNEASGGPQIIKNRVLKSGSLLGIE